MLFACTHRNCYYIFMLDGTKIPDRCPDCGSRSIRPATPEEAAWFYLEHRKEVS